MIIVTRHAGTVAWLESQGITGRVIAHASPADVAGQDIIGVLPLNLAATAASVTVIDLPDLRQEDRGRDLTPAEMDAAGAHLTTYVVRWQEGDVTAAALAKRVAETEATECARIASLTESEARYTATPAHLRAGPGGEGLFGRE